MITGLADYQSSAEKLVEIGLWEQSDGGYIITGEIRIEFSSDKSSQELRKSSLYKKWRIAVLDRDNFKCVSCGSSNETLHAHHIKPWAKDILSRFDVDNGTTLCIWCHSKIHGRRLYDLGKD